MRAQQLTVRPAGSAAAAARPVRPALPAATQRRWRRHTARAEGTGSSEAGSSPGAEPAAAAPPAAAAATQQQQQQQAQAEQAASPAPLLAPGQGTAIVTGAISILFGVAYLVLVSLLDMRGGEMLPPPPEAYGP